MRHRDIILPILLLAPILAAGGSCSRPGAAPDDSETAASAAAATGETSAAGTIRLSEEAVRAGGIAVEPVRAAETVTRIAATGEVEFDPRRLVSLTARAEGRIERVAAYRGDRVAAGQALAEIYSRDFLALQADVVQAAERVRRLKGTPDEAGAAAFLEAAKAKLVPLGLTPAEADAIAVSKTARETLTVRSPLAGRVIEQSAVAGDAVAPGAPLFRVADLSTVWARVRVRETDLGAVAPGVDVVLRMQAYPGEEFRGRLTLLEAVMDEKTRTVEARVEAPNPAGKLRPGMFVEASIPAGGTRRVLQVPESALQEMPTGPAVFVRTAPGTFALRPVEAGERSGARVEIVRGLAEGEEVVTAGSFVLKSELLKGSLGD